MSILKYIYWNSENTFDKVRDNNKDYKWKQQNMGKIMPLLVKPFHNPLAVFIKVTTNIDFTKQLLKRSKDPDAMACVHRLLSVCYDTYTKVLYKVLWKY